MKLYIRLEAPFEWVKLNDGKIDSFGEVPELGLYPLSPKEHVIGVVPSEFVTAHSVNLPTKTRKQFISALPFALEESLSEEIEQLHFSHLDWQTNKECIAYTVSKEKMREWQRLATDNGLAIETLVPDFALLPLHQNTDCSIALCNNRILIHFKSGYGATTDKDFLDIWLDTIAKNTKIAINDEELTRSLIEKYPNLDIRFWPFGAQMAHWLEQPVELRGNLLTHAYKPKIQHKTQRSYKLPLYLITLGILIKFLGDSYLYFSLKHESHKIRSQMQEILTTKFPQITNIIPSKERFLMQQELQRNNSGSALITLPEILTLITPIIKRNKLSISKLNFKGGELVITCELSDFAQVDKISTQFQKIEQLYFVLQQSSANGDKVNARFMVRRK